MSPEGEQTRQHNCFLAMFPFKGGQTRRHCFVAMFRVKHSHVSRETFEKMHPERASTDFYDIF